jgi:hypothetical protein
MSWVLSIFTDQAGRLGHISSPLEDAWKKTVRRLWGRGSATRRKCWEQSCYRPH